MKIFDRLTNKTIHHENLPKDVDLGRFFVMDENVEYSDRYNSEPCRVLVHDSILSDDTTDKSFGLLRSQEQNLENQDALKGFPILSNVGNSIKTTEFEELLIKNFNHINQIFAYPFAKLLRNELKIPVSKAKRVTPKSYQYLGAHTEDWQQRSIVTFRPSRILTEELDLDYNVYENQLVVAFIQKTCRYLRRRIKSIRDNKELLEDYEKCLNDYSKEYSDSLKEGRSLWYAKVHRNFDLFSKGYKPEGKNSENDKMIANETLEALQTLLRDSNKFLGHFLCNAVDSRLLDSITYHDTNVLISHPDYRYIKELWIELNKADSTETDEQKHNRQQNTIGTLSIYTNSLLKYVVQEYFHYEISKTKSGWTAHHSLRGYLAFPDINCEIDNGVFSIKIGKETLRIVCFSSMHFLINEIPNNTFVLNYYTSGIVDIQESIPSRVIPVSMKDVDSCERLAMLLRSFMIREYVREINKLTMSECHQVTSLDFLSPESIPARNIDNLHYFNMGNGFVLDIQEGRIEYINKSAKYEGLTPKQWGMDRLTITLGKNKHIII